MISKVLSVLLFLVSFNITYAESMNGGSNTSQSIGEIKESRNCCYGGAISYCDPTAGHYVCTTGGYSDCVCTNTAPVSTYRQLALGCCLWHGGVVASTLGQVVCADGSLSAVCSQQTSVSVAGMSTI